MKTAKRIRRFIDEITPEARDADHDPLTEGYLDSLAIEQLIGCLEDEYHIEFDDEELVWENFANVGMVATLVDEKRRRAR